jgi:hypothetical protein
LIEIGIHNVKPSFIRAFADLGMEDLTIDELVGARMHGVRPKLVAELNELGIKVSMDDAIQLADHGVYASYARKMIEAGLEDPAVDDLIALFDSGVRPKFVRQAIENGLDHPTLDQLLELWHQS